MSSNRLGSRGKTKHCYKNLTKTATTMSSPNSGNNSHLEDMKQESHLGTKIPNLSHFVLGNNPQKSNHNPKRTNSTIHYYRPNSTQGWTREEKKNNSNFIEEKSVIKEVKREPGSPVLLQDPLLQYRPHHQHYLDSSSHKATECQKGLSASIPIAAFHHVDIKREPCEEGDSMELQNLLSTLSPPPYISPLAVCNPSHEIPNSLLCCHQQQKVQSSYAPHHMFRAQQESYLETSTEYSYQQISKTDHHFHPQEDHMFSDKRTYGLTRADELPACCSSYARDGHLNFTHSHGHINHPCFGHPTQHQQRQYRSEDMTSSSPVSTASSSPLSNETSPWVTR